MARITSLGVTLAVGAAAAVALLAGTAAGIYWITAGQAAFGGTGVALMTAAAVVLARLTRTAVRRELAMRHRTDWGRVAELEREVFGQAFWHDGAPEPRPVTAQSITPPDRTSGQPAWSVRCSCGMSEFSSASSMTDAEAAAMMAASRHAQPGCIYRVEWGTRR